MPLRGRCGDFLMRYRIFFNQREGIADLQAPGAFTAYFPLQGGNPLNYGGMRTIKAAADFLQGAVGMLPGQVKHGIAGYNIIRFAAFGL